MSDDFGRIQLQKVAAYRELCRHVRRSGRGNVGFALLMICLAYWSFQMRNGPAAWLFFIPYLGLALCEFAVGLFKYIRPSAEGVLLDGLVLLMFAGWNLGLQALVLAVGGAPLPFLVILGVLMLLQSFGRFKAYVQLRRLFADRPTPEQVAWFDDLIAEIRAADPETDQDALDLPTKPHLKAKLLGGTAFFVGKTDETVWVAGPDDFFLLSGDKDHDTRRRRAALRIHDTNYPDFDLPDATGANYERWRKAQAG